MGWVFLNTFIAIGLGVEALLQFTWGHPDIAAFDIFLGMVNAFVAGLCLGKES